VSFTDTRAALAAALSTVDGITGHEKRPAAPKIGAAWPIFDSAVRGPGDAFEGTWRVIVLCGGDENTATDFLDDNLPELCAALDPTAFVDTARAAISKVNGTDVFVVEITARSE
jgi:hypothetical protein